MKADSAITAMREAAGPLPGQGSPAVGDPAGVTPRHLAWQREMERAQLADWFRPIAPPTRQGTAAEQAPQAKHQSKNNGGLQGPHGGVQKQPDSSPVIPPETLDRQSTEVPTASAFGTRAVAGPWRTTASDLSERRLGLEHEAFMARVTPSDVGALYRSGLLQTQDDGAAASGALEETRAEAGRDAVQLQDPLPPLRLHEEVTPKGVAIWVAMHADDAILTAMLPGIVADLQRGLQGRGQRLHQVVCNGRLIWRDGAAAVPEENFVAEDDLGRLGMFYSIKSKEA